MTVCIALKTPDGVWMGADSLASDQDVASVSASPKCGKFGNLLIGFAGSWKVGQQIFEMAGKANQPTMKQILDNFTTEIKEWSLLFVENGKIYEVDEDLACLEAITTKGVSYSAIGSGAPVALGALYLSHEDESSLMRALEASAEHTPNVRAPFRIVSL